LALVGFLYFSVQKRTSPSRMICIETGGEKLNHIISSNGCCFYYQNKSPMEKYVYTASGCIPNEAQYLVWLQTRRENNFFQKKTKTKNSPYIEAKRIACSD
jgi:hypothetical protein